MLHFDDGLDDATVTAACLRVTVGALVGVTHVTHDVLSRCQS